jgi:hypothetical protein
MFRIGQKVVCIAGPLHYNPKVINKPVIGRVYTVRGICAGDHIWTDKAHGVGILLEELINDLHVASGEEYGFYAKRFRPVVEKKTDISAFQRLLKTKELVK